MKFFGSIRKKITKYKYADNVPNLKITEDHQIFIPNKSFAQLLEISTTNFIFLKIFNSEFLLIEVWFANQNSHPLELEDRINLTLASNEMILIY